MRDYEVFSGSEKESADFKAASKESWMWSSEYDEALKLEKDLISQFKGKNLEEVVPGRVVSNEYG